MKKRNSKFWTKPNENWRNDLLSLCLQLFQWVLMLDISVNVKNFKISLDCILTLLLRGLSETRSLWSSSDLNLFELANVRT